MSLRLKPPVVIAVRLASNVRCNLRVLSLCQRSCITPSQCSPQSPLSPTKNGAHASASSRWRTRGHHRLPHPSSGSIVGRDDSPTRMPEWASQIFMPGGSNRQSVSRASRANSGRRFCPNSAHPDLRLGLPAFKKILRVFPTSVSRYLEKLVAGSPCGQNLPSAAR